MHISLTSKYGLVNNLMLKEVLWKYFDLIVLLEEMLFLYMWILSASTVTADILCKVSLE